MTNPGSRYQHRVAKFQKQLEHLEKRFNRVFYLKIALIFGGLVTLAFWAVLKNWLGCGATLLCSILLFVLLDIRHHKIMTSQRFTAILKEINERSLWRLDGRWSSFADTGEEFKDGQHPYSLDLDIFGQNSLFQWTCAVNTFLGRQKLAQSLTNSPETPKDILARQEAIEDLAHFLSWRQRFAAYGLAVHTQLKDPAYLFQWVAKRERFYTLEAVILAIRFLTFVTTSAVILFIGFHLIPFYIPLVLLLIHYFLLKTGFKKRNAILVTAADYQKDLALYKDLLKHIEGHSFRSLYLKKLHDRFDDPDLGTASNQLRRLEKIVDAIASRNNMFYVIVNIVTLWDYHFLFALERWKAETGQHLETWLETLAQFEALASLAIINHDHPDWAQAAITGEPHIYTAVNIGHPLLPDERRVANNITIHYPTQALLITGSNMSGKSTYLRTAGINLVLAYAGARVCAGECRCSIMRLYTCMRVSDNLEQNISSFYAEILRIKMMIQASTEGPVFFLLDEIFKGTNSVDRHTGAKILINKLIRLGAVGLVSTHDLELGELANESAAVMNHHFQEFYENNRLCFDYKLRPGISTTRNALHLMQLAGIEVD